MVALELKQVSKFYYGHSVLKSACFHVDQDEIHGILGTSGSGKTTIVRLMSGNVQPDRGAVLHHDKPTEWRSPLDAINNGISAVLISSDLIDNLTVAENVYIYGYVYKQRALKRFSLAKMATFTASIFKEFGFNIDPYQYVSELSIAEKRMVKVAAAIGQNPEILILDDPFVLLTNEQVALFTGLFRYLRGRGMTIIFTTGHIEAALSICDRVTVIREGLTASYGDIGAKDASFFVQAMSDTASYSYPRISNKGHREALSLSQLSTVDRGIQNISFKLYDGEILGVAGAPGSGKSTLARSLFGLECWKKGTLIVDGKECRLHEPADAVANRIGFIPNSSSDCGIIDHFTAAQNISIASLDAISNYGVPKKKVERTAAYRFMKKFSIDSMDVDEPAISMSGGNIQKLMFCRWLMRRCNLLIMDNSTKSVGISMKVELYNLMNSFAMSGGSILLISSDFNELLGMCDRIIVLRNGKIERIIEKSEFSMQLLVDSVSI